MSPVRLRSQLMLHPFSKLRVQAKNSFSITNQFYVRRTVINGNDERKQIYI